MKTSLIFSLALLAIGSANIKDMHDCRPLEVTYPYTFGDHVIIKSNPPIMKCEHRCEADRQSFKMRELVVKKGGETMTVKALVPEDLSCYYDSERYGAWGEKILF